MPNSSYTQAQETTRGQFGEEIQSAVRAELDLILAAPAFSQSPRCKSFLRHVVLNALAGKADDLKERIIGINVFGRPTDFNTSGDSIVRVTANEVRKRIGQFYQESKVAHSVQIVLPRGTYLPEFRIHPDKHAVDPTQVAATTPSGHENEIEDSQLEPGHISSANPPELPATSQSQSGPLGMSRRLSAHKLLFSFSLIVLTISAVAISFGILRTRSKRQDPGVWGPFLNAKKPVLLSLGTHDIPDPAAQTSPAKDQFYDLVLHRDIVPIGDVQVLTSIEKLLGKQGIQYQFVPAEQVSLAALQKQPVILIGAAGNPWTLRLTQGLRYRIRVDWPSGPDHAPVASILDSDEPGGGAWVLDFSVPMDQWKNDYAIIARENDASIGVPVLVIAGLGNFGTVAASEVLASDALAQTLTSDGSCREKPNFEAVIGTEITGAHAGPPHILRETCW